MKCHSFCTKLCQNINRRKPLPAEHLSTDLHRCLGVVDLILLGLSAMLGSGLYVLTGTVAQSTSGPSVCLSYLGAAVAAFLSALCYAEFGSRIPATGSSYIFTYLTMGEMWGFLMGWNMILEHGVGSAAVAKAWSGYLDSALGYPIKNFLIEKLPLGNAPPFGGYLDLAGAAIVLLLCGCVALGATSSTRFNMVLAFINLAVVLFIIVTGFYLADIKNWTKLPGGFLPFGFSGVIAGASRCFFAYAGFDVIASSCEEARNPKRDVPVALAISLAVATVSYVCVSAALTLMVPWTEIVPKSAFPDAYGRHQGWQWAQVIVTVGSLCTMTTSMFSGLFVMPRILYAISKDGLLCPLLSKVNERTQVPFASVACTAVLCSLLTLLFDLEILVQFMSIGTLTAYSFVAACVILLRYGAVGDILIMEELPPDGSNVQIKPNMDADLQGQKHSIESNPLHAETVTEQDDRASSRTNAAVSETSALVRSGFNKKNNLCQHEDLLEPVVAVDDDIEPLGRKCCLKPEYKHTTVERMLQSMAPETAVLSALVASVVFSAIWMSILADHWEAVAAGAWWAILLIIVSFLSNILSVFVIYVHQPQAQSSSKLKNFKVPFVPILPLLCIWTNVFFMIQLQVMTWIRLFIWIFVGLIIYFAYGYHYSEMNQDHCKEQWDARLRRRWVMWWMKMKGNHNDEEELISRNSDQDQ